MKLKALFVTLMVMFCIVNGECECKNKGHALSPLDLATRTLLTSRQRTDLINYLIVKNGYTKYLEVGVASGDNLRLIKVDHKVGVDTSPTSPCDYHMTSDEFFKINTETFDIIFIDGLHHWDQVLRDVENGLRCLNRGGIIVMHDCMPVLPEHQSRDPIPGAWNGDVWKAAAYIRMNFENVYFCVVDMDWGCGVLTPNSTQNLFPRLPIEKMDWDYYVKNKIALLNVKSVENWVKESRERL